MNRERGFTLLEVLLATLLLASAIAVTAASIQGISRAQARSDVLLQESIARNAVANLLRARLGSALAVKFDPGDGSQAMFVGTEKRIEFIADLPAYFTMAGPMRQVIESQAVGSQHRICVVNGPRDVSGLACQAGQQTTLVSGLASVEFRYRGRTDDGQPGPWLSEWKRTEVLPEWVRVQLSAPAGESPWPQVDVRVPLAVNPSP